MAKQLSAMSMDELVDELEAWGLVINGPKGPGSPPNSARDGAVRLYEEAGAWLARREMEASDADHG